MKIGTLYVLLRSVPVQVPVSPPATVITISAVLFTLALNAVRVFESMLGLDCTHATSTWQGSESPSALGAAGIANGESKRWEAPAITRLPGASESVAAWLNSIACASPRVGGVQTTSPGAPM